jgi:hypothetical protein
MALLEVASVGTRRDLGTAGRNVGRGAHKRHDVGGDLLASWRMPVSQIGTRLGTTEAVDA